MRYFDARVHQVQFLEEQLEFVATANSEIDAALAIDANDAGEGIRIEVGGGVRHHQDRAGRERVDEGGDDSVGSR